MNLVYLYGPPAVGKLTVANELARLTSFKVFHNHLSSDFKLPFFEFGTDSFWRVVYSIRLAVIEEAARQGVDLICTSVYVPSDREVVRSRCDAVERHGGRVCFVQLTCEQAALERRVEGRIERRTASY